MKHLKLYTVIGILFVIIFGTLLHFVYQWTGKNFLAGFVSPVNESVWEHMKLAFFPMLLYSSFMNQQLKENDPCVTSSLYFGIILSTLLIPVIYYAYTSILGHHIPALDIATFVLSIIISFVTIYFLTLSCKMEPYQLPLKLIVGLLTLLFFLFTYAPPAFPLFAEPEPYCLTEALLNFPQVC